MTVPVVSEITPTARSAALRGVLLHRPDAHPCWHTYVVSLVHLRPMEGIPLSPIDDDGTHEIAIIAIDPRCTPDPAVPATITPLHPANLIHQVRCGSDAAALVLFDAFVKEMAVRVLSPDTDHRRCQVAWLQRWGKSS